MRNFVILVVVIAILAFAASANAQLAGVDTAPGDSCSGVAQGAARMVADADQDGRKVILICNGTTWEADSAAGKWLDGVGANEIYYSSANVGVGTDDPAVRLDVAGTLRIGDGGETCSSAITGAMRYTTDNEVLVCNGTDWIAIAGVTGGSGGGCTDTQTYSTPGQYSFTVDAGNFGCTFRIKVYGGSGGNGNNGSGGKGGAAQFEFTPSAMGDFEVYVGAKGQNSNDSGANTVLGGGAGASGTSEGGGGGGASAVGYDDGTFTLLMVSGGGGGGGWNGVDDGGDGGNLNGCGADGSSGGGQGGCTNVGGSGGGGGGDGGGDGGNGGGVSGGTGIAVFKISGGGTGINDGGAGGGGYGGGGGSDFEPSGAGGGGYVNVGVVDNETAITKLPTGNDGRVEIAGISGTPLVPAGTALDDLSDVAVPAPNDGEILMYSAGMSQWVGSSSSVVSFTPDPAGNDREIQFNSGGAFGADPGFVFTSTGKLGVGTAAPSELLHVLGANSPDIRIEATSDSGGASFEAWSGTTSPNGGVMRIHSDGHSTRSNLMEIGSLSGADLAFLVGSATELIRLTSAGHVGIGTTDPKSRLQIGDGGASANTPAPDILVSNNGTAGIAVRDDTAAAEGYLYSWNGGIHIGSYTATNLFLNTDDTERITVLSTGEVGIGTADPAALLDVAGEIRFGSSGLACDVTTEGAQRYDTASQAVEYCDGSAWTAVGGGASAINDLSDAYTDYVTYSNLYMGQNAGVSTSPSQYNIAIGQNALSSLDTNAGNCVGNLCDNNLAIGYNAGTAVTTGFYNLFIGQYAGASQTTGNNNLAIGPYAGKEMVNTTANTFVGPEAGRFTTGGYNTAIGSWAGRNATTGVENTYLGANSGWQTTTASNNTLIGNQAGNWVKSSGKNAALGDHALYYYEKTGGADGYNVAIGYNAYYGGVCCGNGSVSGTNNTIIGALAGDSITTGSDNILIGYNADVPDPTISDFINIGDVIYSSAGNVGIGTTDPQSALDVTGAIQTSDRIKITGTTGLPEPLMP